MEFFFARRWDEEFVPKKAESGLQGWVDCFESPDENVTSEGTTMYQFAAENAIMDICRLTEPE